MTLKNNANEYEFLKKLNPDIVIVVAYGQIIPKEFLKLCKLGFINIHGSILPKWRGAAPIQRSIMNLDKETGISIMKLVETLDSGPVSNIHKIKLDQNDNAEEISEKLSFLAAKKILDEIDDILDDKAKFIDQDHSKASYAKKIEKISYDEMLELSSLGAKVMQSSAVQTAMMYDIPLEVKSTFTKRDGTKIFHQESIDYKKSVTGVAYSKDDAKITLIGVEDRPGVAANIFEPLNKEQINVDMVIQNISSDQKTTDITFTIKREDLLKTKNILSMNKKIKYKNITNNNKVSKIMYWI